MEARQLPLQFMGKCRENRRRPKREGKVVTVGKAESVPSGRGATVKLKDGTEIAQGHILRQRAKQLKPA